MMTDKKKQADKQENEKPSGLELMRKKFEPNLISKLPKPTKKQTEEVKADWKAGIRCTVCGQWHHKDVVHLDYVGHAALTDRMLDCDINWSWEPVAFDQHGCPFLDSNGGIWIKLTVCGMTRLGYGHPDGKKGGDAVKEAIGDALRNAAMRFGAALDLWHKGDLHLDAESEDAPIPETAAQMKARQYDETIEFIRAVKTVKEFEEAKLKARSLYKGLDLEKKNELMAEVTKKEKEIAPKGESNE